VIGYLDLAICNVNKCIALIEWTDKKHVMFLCLWVLSCGCDCSTAAAGGGGAAKHNGPWVVLWAFYQLIAPQLLHLIAAWQGAFGVLWVGGVMVETVSCRSPPSGIPLFVLADLLLIIGLFIIV
jgi:hypothetical protein